MENYFDWAGVQNRQPLIYVCGYCGNSLSSEKGWIANHKHSPSKHYYIYVCHNCGKPTFFDSDGNQTPGASFGDQIKDISDPLVASLYNEAKNCMKENAFTASVLCCRKLLMHIAVSQGAKENQSFISYVEYLSSNSFIPPNSKGWVDHIRNKGNEATHDIVIMSKDEAERLILFISMLLKIIYEFPASIPKIEHCI